VQRGIENLRATIDDAAKAVNDTAAELADAKERLAKRCAACRGKGGGSDDTADDVAKPINEEAAAQNPPKKERKRKRPTKKSKNVSFPPEIAAILAQTAASGPELNGLPPAANAAAGPRNSLSMEELQASFAKTIAALQRNYDDLTEVRDRLARPCASCSPMGHSDGATPTRPARARRTARPCVSCRPVCRNDGATPSASSTAPVFPMLTPCMVLDYELAFKALGYIPRSDEARKLGLFTLYDPAKHFLVFVSHTWWHRPPPAETQGKYDCGRPDYPAGTRRRLKHGWGKEVEDEVEAGNLKWHVIVNGVERLLQGQPHPQRADRSIPPLDLRSKRLVLWVDWCSIDQDDHEKKLLGVKSLIRYVQLADCVLIPMEEERVDASYPEQLPGYGKRGRCHSRLHHAGYVERERSRGPLLRAVRTEQCEQLCRAVRADSL